MDLQTGTCPKCHQGIAESNFYCSNCGTNLKPPPPDVSFGGLTKLFLGTILLPPIGILWGLRYLKGNSKAQVIGMSAIVLTIIELGLITITTIQLVNGVNEQVNSQLQQIQAF